HGGRPGGDRTAAVAKAVLRCAGDSAARGCAARARGRAGCGHAAAPARPRARTRPVALDCAYRQLVKKHPIRLRRGRGDRTAAALLVELDPDFAAELERRLAARRDPALAATVGELRVVDRCRCENPNCASFYTVEPFNAGWLWLRGGRTIRLEGW